MSNELHAVHGIIDYEGHVHLSIHPSYEEAMAKAKELAKAEAGYGSYHVYVTPVVLGEDVTSSLGSAEEVLA